MAALVGARVRRPEPFGRGLCERPLRGSQFRAASVSEESDPAVPTGSFGAVPLVAFDRALFLAGNLLVSYDLPRRAWLRERFAPTGRLTAASPIDSNNRRAGGLTRSSRR